MKYLNEEALSEFETYIINGVAIDFKGKLPKGLEIDNQNKIPLFKIDSLMDLTILKKNLTGF